MVWKYWRNKKGDVHDILIQFNPFFNLDSKILTLLRCYRKSLKWPKEQHLCTSDRKPTPPTSIQAGIVSKLFHWTALAVGGCTFPAVCARSVWLFILKFKQDHSCDPMQSGGPWSVFTNHSLCLKGRCDKCSGVVGHSQGEVFFLSFFLFYFSNAKRHLQNVVSLDNMKPGTPC